MKRKTLRILKICLFLALVLSLSAFAFACSNGQKGDENPSSVRKKYTVHFEVNTEYQTNAVLDQSVKEGMHAKKPTVEIVQDGIEDLVVFGWYTERDCINEWSFRKAKITSDLTLYAKWGYEYNVNYYLVDDQTLSDETLKPVYSDVLREGECAEEYIDCAVGFDYLGSFKDRACTEEFDFSRPLTASADIYIKKSAGISFSESNISGSLSENLNAVAAGSYIDNENPENNIVATAGWAESISVGGKEYTYVNFGNSPYNPDPYVEILLPLDISKSQTLTFTFKNLGSSNRFSIFYTTYADATLANYSLTGRYYTSTFSKSVTLSNSQRKMSETDDEWIEVTFDLTEMTKEELAASNGYSVWGTSPYLAALRIQSTYTSTSEDDYSNAYIIKSIVGGKKDVVVEDAQKVTSILSDDSAEATSAKADGQESVNGFIFPKDYAKASVSSDGSLYNKEEGLLLYTQNEIALRGTSYDVTSLALDYSGETFDLTENCTFNIRLKNLGYNDKLRLYVYNDSNLSVSAEINIESEMESFQNYYVNLSGSRYMKGNLGRVVIEYESLGVNNAIIIESVYFSAYRPNDIAGINLNDKYSFGFTSSDKIAVSYDSALKGTTFNVSTASADKLVAQKSYKFTNDGYAGATLQYYITEATDITAVTVGYSIGLSTRFYTYPVESENVSRKMQESYVEFLPEDKGDIYGVSISFYGSGKITIAAVEFKLDAQNAIDFSQSMSSFYSRYDWAGDCKYVYDSSSKSAKITPQTGKSAYFRTYPGYMADELKSNKWTPSENIPLSGKKSIKIIYQNQSALSDFNFTACLDTEIFGTGENKLDYSFSAQLKTEMSDYEWATVTFDIADNVELNELLTAADGEEYLLAKTIMAFSGTLKIRAIVIE